MGGLKLAQRAPLTRIPATRAPATSPAPRLEQVVAWLREINPDAPAIEDGTDLFESGLVTSIQFVELVLLVEELRGDEIVVDDTAIERFRSLRAIAENYLR